jgi:O-antigen ligase
VLGIYLFKGVKGGTRSFMMASFLLMLLGTYFTYTRSALMGVAVGFVALAMLVRSRDRPKILLMLFLVGFVFLLFSTAHDTRLVSTTDTSAEGRVVLRDVGLDIARDNPLFGIGAYNFETVSLQYAPGVDPGAFQRAGGYETLGQYLPHNDFVYLAACYGVPALIVFIWLLAILLLGIRDTYRAAGRPFIKGFSCGLIGALLAYLVNAYYHNCLFDIPLLWVLVGFSLAVAKLTLHDGKILGNSNGIRPST